METETLLLIIVILGLVIVVQLAILIGISLKILHRKPQVVKSVEVAREAATVPKEKKSESGRLRRRTEAAPRIPGIRICPRCYSPISNESEECPACKNPLR